MDGKHANGSPATDQTVPGQLAIEARGLTKRYGGRIVAVDGLGLVVERGETYGLLGPNRAGKTTTLRMLLGLVKPTSGTAIALGRPSGHPESLSRIGAMVEAPSFYPFLSGRDNLRVVARRSGLPDSRVDEALNMVVLGARAGDAFRKYSLGMKQRLGVAAALLKDPELLILDEPSNSLDPAGQWDMRALIRKLGKGGRAIILSSHDLSEVERLCDRVGVIGGGRMLAEGTVEELRGEASLIVRAEPKDAAASIAGKLSGVRSVDNHGEALAVTVVLAVSVTATFVVAATCSLLVYALEAGSASASDAALPTMIVVARGLGVGFLISATYVAAGLTLGTLFRSAGAAIAAALVWTVVVQALLDTLALQVGGALETANNALPNANALSLIDTFGAVGGGADTQVLIRVNPTIAVWVLVGYTVTFLALGVILLWRRDVA